MIQWSSTLKYLIAQLGKHHQKRLQKYGFFFKAIFILQPPVMKSAPSVEEIRDLDHFFELEEAGAIRIENAHEHKAEVVQLTLVCTIHIYHCFQRWFLYE